MTSNALNEYRATRLADLLEQKFGGNKAELGKALGYKSGAFVRQMIDGERAITEKTVAKVEGLRGCKGWFSGLDAPTDVSAQHVKFLGPDAGLEPWSPFGAGEASTPHFEGPVPHEVALEILGQSLNALSPLLQDAGRAALMKWVSGQTTAHQAAVTLNALLQASQAIAADSEEAAQSGHTQDLPQTKSFGT